MKNIQFVIFLKFYLGLIFDEGIFLGFVEAQGFFWVFIFAPIRSSPLLEIPSTLPLGSGTPLIRPPTGKGNLTVFTG